MQEVEGRSEQAAERDRSERHQQLKSEEDGVDKNPPPPTGPGGTRPAAPCRASQTGISAVSLIKEDGELLLNECL